MVVVLKMFRLLLHQPAYTKREGFFYKMLRVYTYIFYLVFSGKMCSITPKLSLPAQSTTNDFTIITSSLYLFYLPMYFFGCEISSTRWAILCVQLWKIIIHLGEWFDE